jgi:large subunit ribosomal protein L23
MAAEEKRKCEAAEWMYEIIRSPVVTEKSTRGSEHGQVTFKVPTTATKPQVKAGG